MLQVIAAYDTMAKSLCEKVLEAGYDGTEELRLSDFPELNRSIQQIQANFTSTMNNIVINNTSKEWRESNLLQDLLARKVWDYYEASHSDKKYKHFFQTNGDALKAFQERARNDMQLSNALWDRERRMELEDTISAAIEKGMSAVTLSKRVSKYLRDFPSMQRDYAEKFGHASSAKNCQYASIRLARTEINMAYRSAEYERWQDMDFILGFEVKLSHSHPMPDICDDLKGKYPKDFKFLGWHPNCLCYTVPIIAKEEEYWANWKRNPMPETEMNPAISEWAEKNEERIARARERGTLPYFFRDNEKSIVAPINDAAYRARTGRTETQPVGNVEIFAGRKYAKVALEGGGIDYEIYGNPQIIAKQLTEWNKIQREINDVIPAFDVACKKVVAQNNGVRYSGIVRKDRGSALRKIDTFLEYHGSFYNLTDLVRCNISCRADEFHKVVQNVRDNLKLIKDQSTRQYTHQFKADKYICRFMNPQFDNGVVGEIMVTPFEMVCARENEFMARKFVGDDIYEMVLKKAKQHNVELGRGHEFYERYRAAKDNVEKALVGKEMDSYYELIQKCNPFEKGLANKDEDIRLMLKLAAQSKDEVLDKARMLAEEFGGTYTTSHATKTFDSLKRKVLKDGTTPYMMKDTVRTTVIVEEEQIEACKAAAQKIDGFARLKVQLPEKMDGYSGNIVNIETNNGIFGEIQINTPEMIYGKQDEKTALSMLGEKRYNAIRKATGIEGGLGHDLYEVIRVLDRRIPEQMRMKELLVADSKEYYSYFASNSPYKKTRTARQLVKDINEHIEQSKPFLKPKVK